MSVWRTFRFRLKPTASQHNALRDALEHSRQLYNAALAARHDLATAIRAGNHYGVKDA